MASADGSWSELFHGRNLLRIITLAGGVALYAVNIYIVTTILPSVIHDVGGLQYYAWNTTLFLVASIVGSALSATFIEMVGLRWAYLLALTIFSAGTVLCALSRAMPTLLAGRGLQGFGGGLLFALSYALIRLIFETHLWSRAMALASGMWGVATLCGPAIGGMFAQGGRWRWAFWSLLPVVALLALLAISQLAKKSSETHVRSQPPFLIISLLVASVLAVSVASLSTSWVKNLVGIGIGLALAVWMARMDRSSTTKLLPTGAYSLSTRLGMLYAVMSLLVVGVSTEIFVPYFLQILHGLTPLVAGYMTAAMAAGWSVASLFSAGRKDAAAIRATRLGAPIILAGLIALAIMTPRTGLLSSHMGWTLYCGALASVGLGVGLGWPHLLTQVFTAAQPGEETLASASITTVQLYATAFVSALAGVVTNSAGLANPGGVIGAQRAALWLFGAFAVAPLLALVLLLRMPSK